MDKATGCLRVLCVYMFVCDILRCDSVTESRWFLKQWVSLTEGLFVKENTGMTLSIFQGDGMRGGRAGMGGATEKVHCRD